jgi:hypothetical protein
VVYQAAGDAIRIVAVMQLNRKPGYWQGRTPERQPKEAK